MKRKKSLCESCSNRVVIKSHSTDKDIKLLSGVISDCFYEFSIPYKYNGNYGQAHVGNLIVDECSFYNKSDVLYKRSKEQGEDDTDSGDAKESENTNGVTFVNIPGALLP